MAGRRVLALDATPRERVVSAILVAKRLGQDVSDVEFDAAAHEAAVKGGRDDEALLALFVVVAHPRTCVL